MIYISSKDTNLIEQAKNLLGHFGYYANWPVIYNLSYYYGVDTNTGAISVIKNPPQLNVITTPAVLISKLIQLPKPIIPVIIPFDPYYNALVLITQ